MRNLRAINLYGSKVANAHRYPAPLHDTIVEPFAGGAGYSLLHHERQVILVDADPNISNVWRYLIDTAPDEILQLPLIEPGQDVRELDCCEGGRLLISWCVDQAPGPRWHLRKAAAARLALGRADFWGARRRAQAALIAGRVKHWRIFAGHYSYAPAVEATWFVDPPYFDGGKHYRTHTIDYPSLALWCRERRGQVIVCERQGADWLPFRPLYDAPTLVTKPGKRARSFEAIWP